MSVITDVVNDAFSDIGASNIGDINEDSERARRARAIFPTAVRSELRLNAWSFAKVRKNLGASTTPPLNEWANRYVLPSDFIRLWKVGEYYHDITLDTYITQSNARYELEGRAILSNEGPPLPIVYIKDVNEEISLWDTLFRETMNLKLAIKFIPFTVKNNTLLQLKQNEYKEKIREAKRCNAIELPPSSIPDSSWMTGRF